MDNQIRKLKSAQSKLRKRSASRRPKGGLPRQMVTQTVARAVQAQQRRDGAGYREWTATAVDVDAGGDLWLINGVPQGAGETEHPNKKFKCKGFYLRASLVGNANAKYNFVSLVWVLDTEPTGTLPSVGSIFKTASNADPAVYSMLNPEFSARFRVLARRNYEVHGDPDDTGQARAALYIEEYIKLKDIEVTTKSAASDITAIQKNAIYLVAIGNQPDGSPTLCANLANMKGRLQFYDL